MRNQGLSGEGRRVALAKREWDGAVPRRGVGSGPTAVIGECLWDGAGGVF
jgi:hypothetical protein